MTTEASETLDDEILTALSDEINNVVDGNILNTDISVNNEKTSDKFVTPGFRYAISIGYSF